MTILLNLVSLLVGAACGVISGVLFWYFPRNDFTNMQFTRSLMLGAFSTAIIMSSIKLKYPCAGMFGGVLICCVAALKWRDDNERKAIPVEGAFRILWDFFSLPILFVLLGKKLDGGLLSFKIVAISVVVVLIGLAARLLFCLAAAKFFNFRFKERLLMAFAMLPRATLQADLGPTLVTMAEFYPKMLTEANIVLQVCIISVLLSAPVMDFVIAVSGPRLLAIVQQGEVHEVDQQPENVITALSKEMSDEEPTPQIVSSI